MASKVETQVEMKSSADKIWEAIRTSADSFPKIFPEAYRGIEIVEGDGRSVGSIRLLKYKEGMPITFSKEKIDEVDDAKKEVCYSVIDGELANLYKPFKATLKVDDAAAINGDGGSLVKWSMEYDKVDEEVPNPDLIQAAAVKTFKDLDAYLIKN